MIQPRRAAVAGAALFFALFAAFGVVVMHYQPLELGGMAAGISARKSDGSYVSTEKSSGSRVLRVDEADTTVSLLLSVTNEGPVPVEITHVDGPLSSQFAVEKIIVGGDHGEAPRPVDIFGAPIRMNPDGMRIFIVMLRPKGCNGTPAIDTTWLVDSLGLNFSVAGIGRHLDLDLEQRFGITGNALCSRY
jgi:hypothetical protein